MINKFATIENYELIRGHEFKKTNTLNICLIYCVWSNSLYLRLLYISMVSQFKYSDVECVDIKVFVENSLADSCKDILKKFPVEIIAIEPPFNKYTIMSHNSLSKYDKIVISDCDTFFYGKQTSIYRIISKTPEDLTYMMKDKEDNSSIVLNSRVISLSHFNDTDHFKRELSTIIGVDVKILDALIKKNKWYLSCFSLFDKSFFNQEWHEYSKKCHSILNTWCDETVFLTWAWNNQKPILDWKYVRGVKVIDSENTYVMNGKLDYLGIFHPLHGNFCHDFSVQRLYDQILST